MAGEVFTMPCMSKKRHGPDGDSGNKKPPRKGKPCNFWISETLYDALDRFYKSFKYPPKRAGLFRQALKDLLRQEKFWTDDDEKREVAEGFEE